MSGLHLNSTESDLGPVLRWDCPRCSEESDFHLVTMTTSLSLLGLHFCRSDAMLDLRCMSCGYQLRADPSEAAKLQRAADLTRLLLEGELPDEEYRKQLRALDAAFMSDLSALTEEWSCPECGESNPITFAKCWKCSSAGASDVYTETEDS